MPPAPAALREQRIDSSLLALPAHEHARKRTPAPIAPQGTRMLQSCARSLVLATASRLEVDSRRLTLDCARGALNGSKDMAGSGDAPPRTPNDAGIVETRVFPEANARCSRLPSAKLLVKGDTDDASHEPHRGQIRVGHPRRTDPRGSSRIEFEFKARVYQRRDSADNVVFIPINRKGTSYSCTPTSTNYGRWREDCSRLVGSHSTRATAKGSSAQKPSLSARRSEEHRVPRRSSSTERCGTSGLRSMDSS